MDPYVPTPGNVVLVAVALLVTIVLTPAVSGDRRAGSGGAECRRSGPNVPPRHPHAAHPPLPLPSCCRCPPSISAKQPLPSCCRASSTPTPPSQHLRPSSHCQSVAGAESSRPARLTAATAAWTQQADGGWVHPRLPRVAQPHSPLEVWRPPLWVWHLRRLADGGRTGRKPVEQRQPQLLLPADLARIRRLRPAPTNGGRGAASARQAVQGGEYGEASETQGRKRGVERNHRRCRDQGGAAYVSGPAPAPGRWLVLLLVGAAGRCCCWSMLLLVGAAGRRLVLLLVGTAGRCC